MEVADERRAAAGVEHALLDLRHVRGGLGQVHRHSDHFRSGLGELDALERRRARVGSIGHRHRLNDDGRAAADLDAADLHADGLVKSYEAHVVAELPMIASPTGSRWADLNAHYSRSAWSLVVRTFRSAIHESHRRSTIRRP